MHGNSGTCVDRALPIPWFDLGVSVPLHDQRLHLSQVFSDVPGRVLALALGASYRSGITTQSVLGSGWTASWEESFRHVSLTAAQQQAGVAEDATDLIFHGASGREDRFAYDEGSKLWRPAAGFAVALRRTDLGGGAANIELEDTDGSLSTYSRSAIGLPYVLTARRDRWGNRVTYTYGGVDATLSGITDDRGTPYTVAIRARADGQGRRLETLIDTTRDRTYRFAYTDDGARLKSVTVLKSSEPKKDLQTVTFGYQSSGKFELNTVTLPGDSQPYLQVSYAGSQVEKLTYGAAAPQVSDTITASGSSVEVIDTDGVRTRTQFLGETDRTMLPQQQVVDPDQAKITTEWVFNDQLRPLTVTTPTGVETWTWQGAAEAVDDRRATDLPLKRERTPAAGASASVTVAGITSSVETLTTTWTYESAEKYFQPLTVTDEQGVITTFSYDRTRTSLEALQKQWEEASPDERAQLDTTSRETVSVPQQGGSPAVTQLLRNFHGQPLRSLSPAGALTQWSYYGESNTAVADQRRDLAGWLYQTAQTTDTLPEARHQLTDVLPATSTATVLVTTTARDQFGRVESQTSPRGAVSITVYNDLGQVSEQRSPPVIGKTGMADPLVETPDGTDTLRVVEAAEDFSGHGLPKRTLRKTPVLDPTISALTRSRSGTLSATSGAITYRHRILATTIARDGLDRPTTISQSVQGDNGTQEFTYLPNRERVQAAKGLDNVWTVYGYDTAGRQVSTTVGAEKIGTNFDLTSPKAVDQRKERLELDAAGNVEKRFVDYGGDGVGEILEEVCTYDGFARQISCKKSVTGHVTNRAYDAKGRVAAEETLDGAGAPISRVTYAYDKDSGVLASTTDVLRGTITKSVVDTIKLTQTVTSPLNLVEQVRWDGAGRTVAHFTGVGTPPEDGAALGSGLWSATTYDADGNPLAASPGTSLAIAQAHFGTAANIATPNYNGKAPWKWYNFTGQVVRQRQPELDTNVGKSSRDYLPSGFGAPSATLDESGNGVMTSFDGLGQVTLTREDGSDGKQRFTRTATNRTTRTTASIEYGMIGTPSPNQSTVSIRDRMGRVTEERHYSASAKNTTAPDQGEISADSIITAASTGGGTPATIKTVYDHLGRVKERIQEDGTLQSFEYYGDDAANPNDRRQLYQLLTNVPTALDKSLKVRRKLSSYDRFGKPQIQLEIQRDYNTVVQLNQVRGGATDSVATFDHGMLVSESTQIFKDNTREDIALPRPVVWTYDAAGRRKSMTLPSGAQVTYTYNDRSMPMTARILGGGTTIHTLWSAEYTGDFGLLTSEDRWNGAVKHRLDYTGTEHVGLIKTVSLDTGTPGLVSSAEYDQRGVMTKRGIWPTTANTWSRALLYDGLNRLSTSLPIAQRDQFGKDDYQLDASESRTRDTIINDVNVTYEVGAYSRYISAKVPGLDQVKLFRSTLPPEIELPFSVINTRSVTFGWDERGNQTSNGVFTSGWDSMNRQTGSTSIANSSYELGYYYDALGRRVHRIESRPNFKIHVQLIYDGGTLVEEYSRLDAEKPDAAVLIARTNSGVGGAPAVYESWTGPKRDYVARVLVSDMDGSVAGVANNDGILLEKLTYSSTGVGAIIGQADSRGSALVPYGWQGLYREPFTGRLYQGGEVFDPLHGVRMRLPTGHHPEWNIFGYRDPLLTNSVNRGISFFAGGARAVGGGLEAAFGAAFGIGTFKTGIGAVAGAAVAAHGVDTALAGLGQMWSGNYEQSYTERGLMGLGLSASDAANADALIGLTGGLATGFGNGAAVGFSRMSAAAAAGTARLAGVGVAVEGRLASAGFKFGKGSMAWRSPNWRGGETVTDFSMPLRSPQAGGISTRVSILTDNEALHLSKPGAGGRLDFSMHPDLFPAGPGQKAIVRIQYTGRRSADFSQARELARITRAQQKNYTWHHVGDYDPMTNTGTMQLIKTTAHEAYLHDGGVSQWSARWGIPYDQSLDTLFSIRFAGHFFPHAP